jgi:hypothetical protein
MRSLDYLERQLRKLEPKPVPQPVDWIVLTPLGGEDGTHCLLTITGESYLFSCKADMEAYCAQP